MPARNTVQRSIIEDELRRLANHPTADEVYEAVRAEHPSIGKATVYRTLNLLSDEGEIGRVRINNGADRFDHQAFAHYHVRCVECGRVDDVMIALLDEGVNEAAAEASGYQILGHTLQFDGVCPVCRAGEKNDGASTA
ncbi:Fur family transcriptional regulator [Thermophilibacter provencensis]|uniref:Transcriptional repressor n=1 Tax=Thermophilibacter provencensis TaxID=1852386 RepID=A0ABT7V2J7_9ACTN|nr:transcriptional repressor [Thermophilibacter provencensis]MDM8270701.1 transcriptional repressor [Thermophilibacter provencensis]